MPSPLTKARFGKLTEVRAFKKSFRSWTICKCDCGRKITVRTDRLKSGNTASCGCQRRESNLLRLPDLVEDRFGILTVLRPVSARSKHNQRLWICKCDCGRIIKTTTARLRSGHTKSCGCLKNGYAIDIAGETFGNLKAKRPTKRRNSSGEIIWLCKCGCGRAARASASQLVSGRKKSCGCMEGPRPLDLSDKKFGRLKAVSLEDKRGGCGERLWRCECKCGNECIVSVRNLRSGNTRSCGCLKCEPRDFGKPAPLRTEKAADRSNPATEPHARSRKAADRGNPSAPEDVHRVVIVDFEPPATRKLQRQSPCPKRRRRPSKRDATKARIIELIGNQSMQAATIANALDISHGYVRELLPELMEEGKLVNDNSGYHKS